MQKKIVTVIIPVVLIFIIALIGIGTYLYEKYSYSSEMTNLEEYFAVQGEETVAITLGDLRIEEQALLHNGIYYMEFKDVQNYLNSRFYVDENESLLLYTTPTEIIPITIDESHSDVVMYYKDVLYVALDYVLSYTNFSYEVFTEPNRMQLTTEWNEQEIATINKDTNVRIKGGVKSPILRSISAGETVVVLERMEDWTKIKTDDTFIGYVENKFLENEQVMTPESVTTYEEPEYTSIHKDYKINMGWHQVTNMEANGNLENILANTTSLNTISPTWYFLSDNEGNFTDIPSAAYVDLAHSRGLEVWALVENIAYSNEIDFYEIMSYTSKREYLISNLVSSVLRCGADGINIDFENVPESVGEHYIQFIRELSIACRLNGLVLSVDNYVPRAHTEHYNREEQGNVVDYVIIMGYDEHWHGSSDVGSVASYDYVKEGIELTLEDVPAHKIINAVPFYTNIWSTEGGVVSDRQVGMAVAEEFVSSNGVTPVWDEIACQFYAEFMNGTIFYQVWLEEEQSLAAKLSVMDMYDVAGVAQWKLGLEKSSVWAVFEEYLEK